MFILVPPDLLLMEMEDVFKKKLHLSLMLFKHVKVDSILTVLEIVFLVIHKNHHLQLKNVLLDMKLMEMQDVC